MHKNSDHHQSIIKLCFIKKIYIGKAKLTIQELKAHLALNDTRINNNKTKKMCFFYIYIGNYKKNIDKINMLSANKKVTFCRNKFIL